MQCMLISSWQRLMPSLKSGCQNYPSQAVKEEMMLLWNKNSKLLCTIGADGYTTKISEKAFILTGSICDVVSLMDIIPQEVMHATGNFMWAT